MDKKIEINYNVEGEVKPLTTVGDLTTQSWGDALSKAGKATVIEGAILVTAFAVVAGACVLLNKLKKKEEAAGKAEKAEEAEIVGA